LVAQESARPGLVWSLVSAASREALAIGLQRNCNDTSALSAAEKRERQAAFWEVYTLDRKLGLTFGKAYSIPDFEIDVDLPEYSTLTWLPGKRAWIRLCELHGRIYESLYSPRGLRTSSTERRTIIDNLDRELRLWWSQQGQHAFVNCPSSQYSQSEYVTLELTFVYHTTLVMLHRTDRSEQGSQIAVQEARIAIGAIRLGVQYAPALVQSPLILW
jgi:hypothetical protein